MSAFIRSQADAAFTITRFERLYDEALAESAAWSADAGREACAAASSYLVTLADMLKGQADERRRHADTEARSAARLHAAMHEVRGIDAIRADLAATRHELSARGEALSQARHDLGAHARALASAEAAVNRARSDCATSRQALAAAHRELDALRGSRTWRLLGAYRGVRNWLREV